MLFALLSLVLFSLATAADVPVKVYVVGKVTASTARLLIEVDPTHSDAPALLSNLSPLTVRAAGAASVTNPDAPINNRQARLVAGRPTIFPFSGLQPDTEYTVEFSGVESSASTFRTFPTTLTLSSTPERILAVSCNKARITASLTGADNLWENMGKRVGPDSTNRASVLLHLGDQVYMDDDRHLLSDDYLLSDDDSDDFDGRSRQEVIDGCAFCTAEVMLKNEPSSSYTQFSSAINQLFREVYHTTWSYAPTAYVLANVPNLAMFDDHEFLDDWGDNFDALDSTSATYFLASIAYELALEYQLQLHADIDFESATLFTDVEPWHNHVYGDIGLMFMDLRAVKSFYREADDSLPFFSTKQHNMWKSALGTNGLFKDVKTLLIISPVPLIFLTRKQTKVATLIDDDVYGHWAMYEQEQQLILDAIRNWKQANDSRELIAIGGDIHMGGFTMVYHKTKRLFFQIITSPIGNTEVSSSGHAGLVAAMELGEQLANSYTFEHSEMKKPRNYGVLEISAGSDDARPVVNIILQRTDGPVSLRTDTKDGKVKLVTGEMILYIKLGAGFLLLCFFVSICCCHRKKKLCFRSVVSSL